MQLADEYYSTSQIGTMALNAFIERGRAPDLLEFTGAMFYIVFCQDIAEKFVDACVEAVLPVGYTESACIEALCGRNSPVRTVFEKVPYAPETDAACALYQQFAGTHRPREKPLAALIRSKIQVVPALMDHASTCGMCKGFPIIEGYAYFGAADAKYALRSFLNTVSTGTIARDTELRAMIDRDPAARGLKSFDSALLWRMEISRKFIARRSETPARQPIAPRACGNLLRCEDPATAESEWPLCMRFADHPTHYQRLRVFGFIYHTYASEHIEALWMNLFAKTSNQSHYRALLDDNIARALHAHSPTCRSVASIGMCPMAASTTDIEDAVGRCQTSFRARYDREPAHGMWTPERYARSARRK